MSAGGIGPVVKATGVEGSKPVTRRGRMEFMTLVFLAATVQWLCANAACAAEVTGARFTGHAFMERVGDDPFVPKFRLVGELQFRQAGGEVWVTPSHAILDGRSVPTLFVLLQGDPLQSKYLKSAISYEYAVRSKQRSWEDAQRMFYEAVTTEGIAQVEGKAMYVLLRAAGSRWALHGPNSCFSRCHTGASELEWRPLVDDEKLAALVQWVRAEDPSLEAIDGRAQEAIVHKGPHVFGTAR